MFSSYSLYQAACDWLVLHTQPSKVIQARGSCLKEIVGFVTYIGCNIEGKVFEYFRLKI